jgi:hypothetical protein
LQVKSVHPERTDMRKSRFTTEQITGFIKQVEAGGTG